MIPLEQIEALLPAALLDKLALTHKVDAKNQIRLTGKLVFLCLLHNLLYHKDLTLRLLEEIYEQSTGQHADHSSFGKRLAVIKPTYFQALFQFLFDKMAPQASEGEARALNLRFVDATTVTLSAKLMSFGLLVGTRSPDKARRHVKSVIELSDGRPNLRRLCKDAAENADSTALGQTMAQHTQPGDLWVFDKGCHSRQRLLDLHTLGAFFLTPLSQQGVEIKEFLWQSPDPPPTAPPKAGDARFVVVRVETGVFANSQGKQNQRWQGMPLVLVHGLRFDKRSKSWKPLTLLTNLARRGSDHIGPYTFAELAGVYAERWALEVFFKFVKQHLNYSHLTSRCENGITVMLYMSLIASLLLLWYQRQTKIDRGWRSVKSWFAFDLRQWLTEAFRETFSLLAEKHLIPVTRSGRLLQE